MQTPLFDAAALQAACKKALTSAAFNKFLTQAVQTVMDDAQAQPEGIVLTSRPTKGLKCRFHEGSFRSLVVEGHGYKLWLQTAYVAAEHCKPGLWFGYEQSTDQSGKVWEHNFRHDFVQDDFGNLVAVAQ